MPVINVETRVVARVIRVIAEEMYNYLEREQKFFQKSKKDEKEEVVEQRINY